MTKTATKTPELTPQSGVFASPNPWKLEWVTSLIIGRDLNYWELKQKEIKLCIVTLEVVEIIEVVLANVGFSLDWQMSY